MSDDIDKPGRKLKLERVTLIESKPGDPPSSNWPGSVSLGRNPVNVLRKQQTEPEPEERDDG